MSTKQLTTVLVALGLATPAAAQVNQIIVPDTDPKAIGTPYGLKPDPACANSPSGISYYLMHCDLLDNPEQISRGPIPSRTGSYDAGPGSPAYAIRDRFRATMKLPNNATNVHDQWWWGSKYMYYCLDYETPIPNNASLTRKHHSCSRL